jgi:hypothetical protein
VVRRISLTVSGLMVALAMVVPGTAANATSHAASTATKPLTGKAFFRQYGYLVANPAKYLAEKQRLNAQYSHTGASSATGGSLNNPIANPSFEGQRETDLAPPDTTGAVGPNNYVEFINLRMGLYNRTGGSIASATAESLFGGAHFDWSDPQVLWDPHTQRFYMNIWDTRNATMHWAFSKNDNPNTLTSSSWCVYTSSFGYAASDAPDYPKLGQTKNFLLIGVNFFQNFQTFRGGDLLTIQKPKGSGPVTTCPSNSFKTHRFIGLKNKNGSLTNAPEPAQQADPSGAGWVVVTPSGSGNVITVFKVKRNKSTGDPVLSGPFSVTVPSYSGPADAQQCSTSNRLDTLDGRLEHAVSAIDPNTGRTEVWTAHAVAGGGGSEERWYEIDPISLTLAQSGKASDNSLYVWNGGIAPDRTVNPSGKAHGGAMVMSFSTSSSTKCPAIQMVSKIGANAQSGFVVVKQSTVPDNDFTCSPCRWGDYSGASPDPGAPLNGTNGQVWIANQWLNGSGNPNWDTWIAGVAP